MNEFICAKHYTHCEPHLANQVDYVAKYGFVAKDAFIKISYSLIS